MKPQPDHDPSSGSSPAGFPLNSRPPQDSTDLNAPAIQEWPIEGGRVFLACGKHPGASAWEMAIPATRVVLLFLQKGRLEISTPEGTARWELGTATHNAFHTLAGTCCFARERETLVLGIEWQPEVFLGWMPQMEGTYSAFASKVQQHENAQLHSGPLFLDLAMQACIQQIVALPGPVLPLYVQAKALELMALQALSVDRRASAPTRLIKTDYDRERILFARDYLLQAMAAPPSLPQLARIAGINEFKLKRGFKELFGNTVYGYLAQARLEIAKSELLEGRKSTTEIAFDLGYASLQHFSTAFKKHFGVSPNRLTK